MPINSLKQLQKHMKFCKKCSESKNSRQLCLKIKRYINQDYCRKNESHKQIEDLESENTTSWVSFISDGSSFNQQELISELLNKLDPINIKIFYYKFWEGKSFREISQLIGFKSKDASFKRFHKALNALKISLPSENEFLKAFHAITENSGRITDMGRVKKHEKH